MDVARLNEENGEGSSGKCSKCHVRMVMHGDRWDGCDDVE